MKQRTIIVNALIAVAVIAIAAFQFRDSKSDRPGIAASELVDKNNPVSFASFKGNVVFVNNWASWCPPCIAEMPSIQELKTSLGNTNIVFVMVSFDEDQQKAIEFMKKRGYNFDVYFPGERYPFETSSIPATFIVDKNGSIVAEHSGMTDYSRKEFVDQLKELAK